MGSPPHHPTTPPTLPYYGVESLPQLPTGSLHARISPFFKRHPTGWALHHYLRFRHPKTCSPRDIVNNWTGSLRRVVRCTDRQCCPAGSGERATELLTRYHEAGLSAENKIAKEWLSAEEKRSQPDKSTQTTHYHNPIHIDVGQGDLSGWEEDDGEENEIDDRETEGEEEGAMGNDLFPVEIDQDPEPSVKRPIIADRYNKALLDLDTRYSTQSKRWKLSSGSCVESILYSRSRVMKPKTFLTSLAPFFVLDTTNKTVESWFTPPEWQEILRSIPPLPEADAYMAYSCVRFFGCKTIRELREVVDSTCYRGPAEPPNYDKHFDARWADMVVRGMLELWESPNQPLRTSHLENWFNSYLWSPIVDRCLLSLRDVTVERSEATCQATARRRNQHRQSPDVRARTGPRLDAVVRTIEGDFDEFCGMEIARGYAGGETSTKWLSDTFKLAKVLRDMLHCLHKRVDHDEAISKTLRVVGVICNGLKLQMVRMECYKGGIAVLTKDDPIQVPVGVEGLLDLFLMIAEVSRMKAIIFESVGLSSVVPYDQNKSHGPTSANVERQETIAFRGVGAFK